MTPAQAEFLAHLLDDLRSPENRPIPKKWVRMAMVIFDQEMVQARKVSRKLEEATKLLLRWRGDAAISQVNATQVGVGEVYKATSDFLEITEGENGTTH